MRRFRRHYAFDATYADIMPPYAEIILFSFRFLRFYFRATTRLMLFLFRLFLPRCLRYCLLSFAIANV